MRAAGLPRYGRYGGGGYPGGWWWGGPTYSGNIGQFCPDCWDDKGDRQDPLPGPTPFPPSVNDQVSKGSSHPVHVTVKAAVFGMPV